MPPPGALCRAQVGGRSAGAPDGAAAAVRHLPAFVLLADMRDAAGPRRRADLQAGTAAAVEPPAASVRDRPALDAGASAQVVGWQSMHGPQSNVPPHRSETTPQRASACSQLSRQVARVAGQAQRTTATRARTRSARIVGALEYSHARAAADFPDEPSCQVRPVADLDAHRPPPVMIIRGQWDGFSKRASRRCLPAGAGWRRRSRGSARRSRSR